MPGIVVEGARLGCRRRSDIVSWARKDDPAYGSIPQSVAVKPRKKLEIPPFGVAVCRITDVADAMVLYAARGVVDVSIRRERIDDDGAEGCS